MSMDGWITLSLQKISMYPCIDLQTARTTLQQNSTPLAQSQSN